MTDVLRAIREIARGPERPLARALHARAVLGAAADGDLGAFVRALRANANSKRILLARGRDERSKPCWFGLPAAQLLGQHGWILGMTGAGKTYLALVIIYQLLRHRGHPEIVFDQKGELAALILDVLVPALAGLPGGDEQLRQLRVVRPFAKRWLPQLRVTAPEPGVSREVQAYNLAAGLEEALSDTLGKQMEGVFLHLAALAIERQEPLMAIGRWLDEPGAFAAAARHSTNPAIRAYARTGFDRANQSSIRALRARLGTFLFLEEVRLCLAAPSCVDFHACLESGLTVIDLGNPPAGAERVAKFWAGILTGRLTRAILSRPITPKSPRVMVVFEEFQEGLGPDQVQAFGRLLSLSRWRRTSLYFLNQSPSQVSAVDPALTRALHTNAGLMAVFRSSFEDAHALAHMLPGPADAEKRAHNRAELLSEITRLRDREYFLWWKPAALRAHLVRSPRLDLEALRKQGANLPPEVRLAIERGTVARSREELQANLDEGTAGAVSPEVEELLRRSAEDPSGDGLDLG